MLRLKREKHKGGAPLIEKIKKIYPDIQKENMISAFSFDLHPEIAGKRVEGIVFADREAINVIIDGEVVSKVPFCDVESFKIDNGVGTVFASYTLKSGESYLLCIGTMSCSKRMVGSVKMLNRIVERGFEYYDKMRARGGAFGNLEHRSRCPKCGRPLPRGSEKCPRCVSKLETIKRLWGIIKPYKWFIFISVILFVAISCLNLFIPEINKILVDDYIIAVKVVSDIGEAIEHIRKYTTGHSEAIMTESYGNARRFCSELDAAAVYVNASTRFTDGGEFGFGAEIGISTQKLHTRGPMGLAELTTVKYIVEGDGQVR